MLSTSRLGPLEVGRPETQELPANKPGLRERQRRRSQPTAAVDKATNGNTPSAQAAPRGTDQEMHPAAIHVGPALRAASHITSAMRSKQGCQPTVAIRVTVPGPHASHGTRQLPTFSLAPRFLCCFPFKRQQRSDFLQISSHKSSLQNLQVLFRSTITPRVKPPHIIHQGFPEQSVAAYFTTIPITSQKISVRRTDRGFATSQATYKPQPSRPFPAIPS